MGPVQQCQIIVKKAYLPIFASEDDVSVYETLCLPVDGNEDDGEGGEEYAGALRRADQLAQDRLQTFPHFLVELSRIFGVEEKSL